MKTTNFLVTQPIQIILVGTYICISVAFVTRVSMFNHQLKLHGHMMVNICIW